MKTPASPATASLSVYLFAVLALVFSAFYIQLSLLGFVLVLLLGFALGAYASVRMLMLLLRSSGKPRLASVGRLVLVLLSWLALWYLPASDLPAYVDVSLFHSQYENQVAKVHQQSRANCGLTLACYVDGGQPAYVFFAYRLHLPYSGQRGILYVPDPATAPQQQRLDKISGAMTCQALPLRAHFFACAMSAYGG
ncbi:hypothetical protein ACO0LF_18430 [Undibacterium sp. Di27W]|uniref:hypothetical protein n=1 Tax=Undibacterium sp. Di27W TaxID=3413036 RepID=UPI003BF05A7F